MYLVYDPRRPGQPKSLPELLTELISDESTRDEMFRRTGVPKVPDDE